MEDIIDAPAAESQQVSDKENSDAQQAQVKLTPIGQKKNTNTLVLPPTRYAIYPMRLSANFDEDIDVNVEYHPEAVEQAIERFRQLKSEVKPLRAGYLYLFVDGFLHQEYKISADESEKALFQKIDLKQDQGKDTRRATVGLKQPFVLAPTEAEKVEIGFSSVQWSWLRINTLGGVAKASLYENAAANEGVSANDESLLAINDEQLIQKGNQSELNKVAEEARKKRLQDITYKHQEEYNHWQSVRKPSKQSSDFIPAIDSEFQDKVAKSENLFLDNIVIGVGVSILHDHLDLLDHLKARHNLALNFMAKLLIDLQNPNLTGEKKALFPNAEHFASATLIQRSLILPGSGSDKKYFSDVAKKYRDLIHVEDLNASLGVKYRQRVNDLIKITHDQLQAFVLSEFDKSLYPQLIQQSEQLWQHELLDLYACQFEQERTTPASNPMDMPVADLLLEFLGNLFNAINSLPRSLDLTIDGTQQDFDEYHMCVSTNKARVWAQNLVDLDNELWRVVANGRLDSVIDKFIVSEQEEDTPLGATSEAQVTRRGIQALGAIFTTFTLKSPEEYIEIKESQKIAIIKPSERYLGIRFERHQLQEVTDINPIDDKRYTGKIKKVTKNNPVLLSHFFRMNQPLVLDKLGGEGIDQIEKRRTQEKHQFEQNLQNDQEAQRTQWEREERDAHAKADDDYAAVKADLEKQGMAKQQTIKDQESAIKEANLNHNDKMIALEKEQLQLETNVQQEKLNVQTAQAQVDSAAKQHRLAQAEYEKIQSQIDSNQQQLFKLETEISNKSKQAAIDAEKKYNHYKSIYGEESAKQYVSQYLAQQQLEIDRLNQSAGALQTASSSLEVRAQSAKAKMKQIESVQASRNSSLENAKSALANAQQQLDANQTSLNSLKTTHESNQEIRKAELDKAKSEYEIFNENKQQKINDAYQESKNKKQAATDTKNQKIANYEKQQEAKRSQYNAETEEQISQRKDNEAAHEQNNTDKAKDAKKNGQKVIDLSSETGQLEYNNHFQGEYNNNVRRVVQLEGDAYVNQLKKKEKLIQKVRPNGAEKGRFVIDQKKLSTLKDSEKALLFTVFVNRTEHQKYIEHVKRHSMITTKVDGLEGVYKTYMAEDAKALASNRMTGANVLNGVLAGVEFINLHAAYDQLKKDGTTHDRMNFLGCVLDTAASMEALALSVASFDKAAVAARSATGSGALWRSFSQQPLGATAALATLFWFSYETYRTGVQNKGDDAAYANGIMVVGSAMGLYSVLSASALAGPVGVVGIGLLLLGTFLVNFVWRENNDLTEYALARGPFGADKDMLAHMGIEDVSITEKKGELEILLQDTDKLWVEQGTYRLTRILKGELAPLTPYGASAPQEFTDFIDNSDGTYSYKTPKGDLYLGKIGDPLGGKGFNDPVELEQFFTENFQKKDDERFSTDLYNDKKLGYQLDASLWRGNENSAKSYFEALISAFYPLSLELEIVPKSTEWHGRMKRTYGNLLRVKYRVPFLAEVVGKPEIELDIVEPTFFESSEKKIYLREFLVLEDVKKQKDYVNAFTQDGFNVVELDLDSDGFLAERRIKGVINVGESYKFVVRLVCKHKIDKGESKLYQQPPILLKERDNFALKDSKHRMRPF